MKFSGCQPSIPSNFDESCKSGIFPGDDGWQPLPMCPNGTQYKQHGTIDDWGCRTGDDNDTCIGGIQDATNSISLQTAVHTCVDLGCDPPIDFNESCEFTGVPPTHAPTDAPTDAPMDSWQPLPFCPEGSQYQFIGLVEFKDWQCPSNADHEACMGFIFNVVLDLTYGVQHAVHDCYDIGM